MAEQKNETQTSWYWRIFEKSLWWEDKTMYGKCWKFEWWRLELDQWTPEKFLQKLGVIGELNTKIANGIEDEEEYQTEFEKGMNLELNLTVKLEALERLLQNR